MIKFDQGGKRLQFTMRAGLVLATSLALASASVSPLNTLVVKRDDEDSSKCQISFRSSDVSINFTVDNCPEGPLLNDFLAPFNLQMVSGLNNRKFESLAELSLELLKEVEAKRKAMAVQSLEAMKGLNNIAVKAAQVKRELAKIKKEQRELDKVCEDSSNESGEDLGEEYEDDDVEEEEYEEDYSETYEDDEDEFDESYDESGSELLEDSASQS